MRDIGNQLLWSLGDSSTRILPVKKEGETWVIAFEQPVALDYDRMVPLVSEKLHAAGIHRFITEFRECRTEEVLLAFAYEGESDSLVPCQGREEPANCYRVEITPRVRRIDHLGLPFALVGMGLVALVYFMSRQRNRSGQEPGEYVTDAPRMVGRFEFVPEERTLKLDGRIFNLTEKETRLLVLLADNPDQTLSREVLMAGIWGGEGVQVIPRNIDVLISKLRKRLQGDQGVQLENVHGVGYKLVVKAGV